MPQAMSLNVVLALFVAYITCLKTGVLGVYLLCNHAILSPLIGGLELGDDSQTVAMVIFRIAAILASKLTLPDMQKL